MTTIISSGISVESRPGGLMNKIKCKRCGWEWEPRTDAKPKVCPRCKSYSYDKSYIRKPKGS